MPELVFGNLLEDECAPSAWKVLLLAARLAGPRHVSSQELWRSLYADPDGDLCRAIDRLGLEWPFPALDNLAPEIDRINGKVTAVRCSVTVAEVVEQAHKTAARTAQLVAVKHILEAMVSLSQGNGMEMLRHGGLRCPQCLTSFVFVNGGELNRRRFDEGSNRALDSALAFGQEKRCNALVVRHLLFGMLVNRGLLERRLREQGVSAAKIAELLRRNTKIQPGYASARLVHNDLETGLLELFCGAERYAGGERAVIEEEHLLRALHAAGAGDAAELLVNNGVKWRRLI